jgi:uncharacterized protein YndB with AHSA1/START domain
VNSLLVRCYPAKWRARYGAEFAALLEEHPLGLLDVVDVLRGALDAQLRLRGRMIESVRNAAVAPADVFRLYADPSTWSEWGHDAEWARADGPLVERGNVDVKSGSGKVYPCRIRRLVDGRALELEVRPPLMTVIQTYEVEPTADGAHIRHALEISGPLAGVIRLVRLDRLYQGWLDKEVGKLIEMAERPAPVRPS